MKKILTLIITSALSLHAYSSIIITKTNGGTNGYYTVTENHDGVIFKDHKLSCTDPGATSCTWTIPPSTVQNNQGDEIPVNVFLIEQQIIAFINNGQLSGTLVNAVGQVSTTWTSTGINNYTFTISYYQVPN